MTNKEFFINDNKSGWKTREDRLKNNHPNIHKSVIDYCIDVYLNEIPFKQKVWHFINNIKEIPKCNCGKYVNFSGNLQKGYNLNCSVKCSTNSLVKKEKTKITSLEKYGFESPAKSKIVRDKYKKTCELKYGVDNVSKVGDIKNKREETTMKKFGVSSVLELETTKNKLLEYSLNNFGVTHLSKSKIIQNQKKETLNKNYGVDTPMASKIIKEKQINTLIKNYGVDNPMKNDELKNKCFNNGIKTKFINFKNNFIGSDIDEIISYSGDLLSVKCNKCSKEYSISRELFSLRHKKNPQKLNDTENTPTHQRS